MARIVVALGGNALQSNPGDVSAESQLKACRETAKAIADLIECGNDVVVVHGNGPQVGQIASAYEAASSNGTPAMPFPECGAMSEGYIGYHLQQAIGDEIRKRKINKQVVSIVTQVIVDKNDPGFKNPMKPVGSFYSESEAKKLQNEKGYVMKEDAGRGFRRVIASPMPVSIVEEDVIKALVNSGQIVIAAGGGGIPVIAENGELHGVPAVIDKDLAAEKLAEILSFDELIILTAVEKVSINYKKPDEVELSELDIENAEKYMAEGQFAPGSMLPKIKSAIMFVKSGEERKAVITSLDKAEDAVKGLTGTIIKR